MRYSGRVMTIAGSDSGGGAGIQADLKTFQAFDVYGMSALTSVTAQNTTGVFAVHDVDPDIVGAQIDAVIEDIGVDAIKTGMLSSKPIIATVSERIRRYGITRLVVDPVMVAKGGARLLRTDAEEAMARDLLPLAYLVTPNIFEAETIGGVRIEGLKDAERAAEIIHGKGPRYVLIKGGHLEGEEAIDLLFDGESCRRFKAARIDAVNTHGTGCTLSAAITACLARGLGVYSAVETAKNFITEAIRNAPDDLGRGNGPLYHRIEPVFPSGFEEAAEDFDAWFDRNRNIFESELLAVRRLLKEPGHAVSVGVGSGLFASRLGITRGVEPAHGMAELARQRGIEVKTAAAENLPYDDDLFDTVLLGTVLCYVDDPRQAVREAFRILKPGGSVVVSFLTREGSYAMMYDLAALRHGHDPRTAPQHPYPIEFIRRARWLSTAEVTALLEIAGFEELEYAQTLTGHPRYSNDQIEEPQEGYEKGDYIVVRGKKP